jgi:hypothetical protein
VTLISHISSIVTGYYVTYLVRLISIVYCKWFMLFMTLDMPDEGTC